MVAVPPNWGPILDYGRLLIMPGLIDIQYLESTKEESSTIQDGITSRLVYISDEIRDKLLLNDKSILPDNFHWSLTNDSLSVGYIFTQPNSTKSFLVNKESFEAAKWCMNPDYLEMPLNICHRIPSLVTIDNNNKDLNNNDDLNKLHPTRFGVSSSIQIPRISSLKLLKNVCQPPYHSVPLFRSVCLYAVALETNFIVDEQVLENCIDYLWNDNDCVGKEEIGDISKNTYRLPIAWTIAQRLGISLHSFHFIVSVYPAKIFGLHCKGKLERGYDADIVVWSPEMSQPFPSPICQKFQPLCQQMNSTLKGVVFDTFVRGRRENGKVVLDGRSRHTMGTRWKGTKGN
jgi:hypothetical protein